MQTKIHYFGQLYTVTGKKSEDVEIRKDTSLRRLLISQAEVYGDGFRTIVLDEESKIRPSAIVVLNGKMAAKDKDTVLNDGDEIKLLTAIAGG